MFPALPCLMLACCMIMQRSKLSFAHLVTPETAVADLLVRHFAVLMLLSAVHQYS